MLPGWIRERRWFRSKSRTLRAVALEALFPCDASGAGDAVLAIVHIAFNPEGSDDSDSSAHAERYLLPLAVVDDEQADALPDALVLGPVMTPAGLRTLIDGCGHEGFRDALFALLAHDETLAGFGGELRGRPISREALARSAPAAPEGTSGDPKGSAAEPQAGSLKNAARAGMMTSRILAAEQSNTSLVYGKDADAVFVKLYRRIEEGVHPEPEMLRFLSGRTTFRNAPAFLSSLRWTNGNGREGTVALAQEFWESATDAWKDMLEGLRADAAAAAGDAKAESRRRLLDTATLLGMRVGAFHRAAASRTDDPDFAPEVFTIRDARYARDRARASLAAGLREVERRVRAQGTEPHAEGRMAATAFPVAEARALLADRDRIEARLEAAIQTFESAGARARGADGAGTRAMGLKIRTHGDLHLGQILMIRDAHGRRDAGLLDFEGEPGRPLAAARAKQSPLRDVAGMLRSFHYAAHAAARAEGAMPFDAAIDPEKIAAELGAAFLDAYFAALAASDGLKTSTEPLPDLLPIAENSRRALLDVFVLEKAAYELAYECDNRPDWAAIPVRGLLALRSDNPEPP